MKLFIFFVVFNLNAVIVMYLAALLGREPKHIALGYEGYIIMGIRSTLKKELMNLETTDLMTADDVRHYLKLHFSRVKNKSVKSFNLISHFNEYHSQIVSGAPMKKETLSYTRHRLFKDVLYPKKSVQQWAKQHDIDG